MVLKFVSLIRQKLYHFKQNLIPKYTIRTVVNLSYNIIENNTSDPESTPLLILHDLLSNKKQWNSLGKTISTIAKRPVITVDQRNHGLSPHASSHTYEEITADVFHLLQKLSIEHATLLGHGMGGKTCMCMALLEPQKVAGLILVDISPISISKQFVDLYPNLIASMQEISFKGIKKVNKAKHEAKKQLKKTIYEEELMNVVLSNIMLKPDRRIGWICNIDVLAKNFKHIAALPTKIKEKVYYGPTLFIGGQTSEYLPPDDLPAIRDIFPRAVITYIPKTGHNLQIDDPKKFLEMTIYFLKIN